MSFRIIHFSDPHEKAQWETWRMLTDKRLIGFLNNRILRRTGHGTHDRIIGRAIAKILKEKPDLTVFSGDAVSCGQEGEFRTAYKHFQPLVESELPFLYVPGNHDCYVRNRECTEAAEKFCLAMNRGKYALKDFPFALDFREFRLIAANTCRPMPPFFSNGYMDRKTSDLIRREALKEETRPLICVDHFPYMDKHPYLHALHILYGAKDVAELLKKRKINLHLCGHVHKPRMDVDEQGRGEVIAGSLTGHALLTEITYDQGIFHIRRIPV